LSASISCSEALAAIRRGERLPAALVRQIGQEQPTDFFRVIVEALSDSFDAADAAAYEDLMTAWIPHSPRPRPVIPTFVETIHVLSRVTLGADIKITSVILAALKRRFPESRIALVANRKCAELYAADPRISHIEADYPRSGTVNERIEFAHRLSQQLKGPNRIVIDPDSRMTQLGMVPVCEAERYFHFPSRSAGSDANLTTLTQNWVNDTFCEAGEAYIAPCRIMAKGDAPNAAISLGVGENDSKRIGGEFEAGLIRAVGDRFRTVWIDRGAGGEEASRVTAASAASGCADRIRFWEGSFAGFASLIAQSNFYAGYDSAGQHAAAACGVPLVTFFAGAPSERFRRRWAPSGSGEIQVVDADNMTPGEALDAASLLLEWRR
jgi:ADP-heptose:LPS heptosyltransferase